MFRFCFFYFQAKCTLCPPDRHLHTVSHSYVISFFTLHHLPSFNSTENIHTSDRSFVDNYPSDKRNIFFFVKIFRLCFGNTITFLLVPPVKMAHRSHSTPFVTLNLLLTFILYAAIYIATLKPSSLLKIPFL